MYREEEYLQLSEIQHFSFCRRQWALLCIEQQWAENDRTVDGHLFHQTAHDPQKSEKRGDILILRGLRVKSAFLGVSGICDVVEFHQSEDGVSLSGQNGRFLPYPIEYKRGAPKENPADRLQLCGEALCLEEMLLCSIQKGALFYGENRRRSEVLFTDELRRQVKSMLLEMHDLLKKGYTPKVKPHKGCSACSLKDLCLPQLMNKKPVETYIRERMKEE